MHGFGSHTFKWVNKEGEAVWVKYHFKTEQGVKNLPTDLAAKLAGENPDYHTEDLFNAIEKGDFLLGSYMYKSCLLKMRIHTASIRST